MAKKKLEAKVHSVGKARGHQCEAAGHVASSVRKQRDMDAGVQLMSPFYLAQDFSL